MPFEAALTAEARLLDPAERGGRVGDHPAVDADHPGLDPLGHAQRAVQRAGVDVGGQAVLGVVGGGDALFLGVEAGDRSDRAEDLLLEDAGVGGHVGQHRRRVEVARAARRDSADGHRGAARHRVGHQVVRRWPPAWR